MWVLSSNNLYFNRVRAQIYRMSDHKGTLRILSYFSLSPIVQVEKLRYGTGNFLMEGPIAG